MARCHTAWWLNKLPMSSSPPRGLHSHHARRLSAACTCLRTLPHRYMSLKEQAEELEGEAATWQLLWFLHGLQRR